MLIYTPPKGLSIYRACEAACAQAKRNGEEVMFHFNDVQLICHPDSRPDDIVMIYALKCNLRALQPGQGQSVGSPR